jgi:hypothetical protein
MRTRRCTGCRHVYSPEAIASVLAAGMGAAGVASGSTIARTADGRQVALPTSTSAALQDLGAPTRWRWIGTPDLADVSVMMIESGGGRKRWRGTASGAIGPSKS